MWQSMHACELPACGDAIDVIHFAFKRHLAATPSRPEVLSHLSDGHCVLADVGKTGLRKTAGLLSERLRERTRMVPGQPKSTMPDPVVYRREEAMAYTAHRLPGVYACTFRVMNEVRHQ